MLNSPLGSMTAISDFFMMLSNEGEENTNNRSAVYTNSRTDFMAVYFDHILIDIDNPVLAPGFFLPVLLAKNQTLVNSSL
jgi:hypothetical protein